MSNPSQQKSLQEYQTALQCMQEGKFEKARVCLKSLAMMAHPRFSNARVCTSPPVTGTPGSTV